MCARRRVESGASASASPAAASERVFTFPASSSTYPRGPSSLPHPCSHPAAVHDRPRAQKRRKRNPRAKEAPSCYRFFFVTPDDIKALRKDLSCTAKELAQALGIEQATV